MKMKKRLIVYLIVLYCILVAFVSVIYLSKVNKYRMTEIETEQYKQALAEYEKITSNIGDIGDKFPKQYDEAINKNSFLYDYIYN